MAVKEYSNNENNRHLIRQLQWIYQNICIILIVYENIPTDKLIQIAINQPLCTGLENGVNQR